jgi:MFS family permease
MNHFSNFLARRLPFFYGYVVVLVALMAQVCSSPGQTFAMVAFTPAIQASLHLSSSKLAAAYMIGTFLAAFPLFLVGPIADRLGLRMTTFAVAIALAGACLIASLAQGFISLIVAFILLRLLGQGAMSLLGNNIVSMWFRQRLGKVNSAMSVGGAIAFALMPTLLLDSIESFGWRGTYQLLGAAVLFGFVPFLLLLRNRPEDLRLSVDGRTAHAIQRDSTSQGFREPELTLRDATAHRSYWLLMMGMVVWAMTGTGIVFYAIPIYEQLGIPASQSKLLFMTLSLCMLLSQTIGGILADRLPMHRLLATGFALLTLGTSTIPFTSGLPQVHLFAALFGAGQGLAIAANSTMWVRYYGRKHLGAIRGSVWCVTVASSGCGPFVLGLFADNFGSFTPGLWLFAGLLASLAPLSAFATQPSHSADDAPNPPLENCPALAKPESGNAVPTTLALNTDQAVSAELTKIASE